MGTWALLVDDGAGTYLHNVPFRTANVGRGRQDEMTEVQPGSAAFVIDDVDGSYVIGSTAPAWWALGARGKLVWTNDAGSVDVFHGSLDSAPVRTRDKAGKTTQVTATFVDDLALMQAKKLRSWIEEELLALGPLVYSPTLGGTWATLPGGVDPTQTPDGYDVTSDVVTLSTTGAGAAYLVFISDMAGGGATTYSLYEGSTELVSVTLTASSGDVTVHNASGSVTLPAAVPTSGQHLISLYLNTTNIVLTVDGSAAGTATSPAFAFNATGITTQATWTGTRPVLAHATVLQRITAIPLDLSNVLAQLGGSFVTTSGDANGRLSALARYGTGNGWYMAHASPPTLTAQPIAGSDALAQSQAVADSCDGIIFAAAGGYLTLQTYADRVGTIGAGPTSTLSGRFMPGLTFPNDKQYVVNSAASSGSTGNQQHVANWPSIQMYGERDSTVASTLLLANDSDVLTILQHRLGGHATPTPERASGLAYDINGIDAQSPSDALALLSLDIGGYHQNTSPPACSPVPELDVLVEGIALAIDVPAGTASAAFETTPTSLYAHPWILEDPTYGVLDSTTVLL